MVIAKRARNVAFKVTKITISDSVLAGQSAVITREVAGVGASINVVGRNNA